MAENAATQSLARLEDRPKKESLSILWYRHGLRLHDNPALLSAISEKDTKFLPVFIFDGESAGTRLVGFNRMRFLLESLEDLHESFQEFGGGLRVFQGQPVAIFQALNKQYKIVKICFEQDCEPIWKARDDEVKEFCEKNGIQAVEKVSNTMYSPAEILEANGGSPPLTYASLMFVVSCLGKPPRPSPKPDPAKHSMNIIHGTSPLLSSSELSFPLTPERFGVKAEKAVAINLRRGGETHALDLLNKRLEIEKLAFEKGLMLPNHSNPDLICGASLSPSLRFGCISVRLFYWSLQDLYSSIVGGEKNCETITGQLFWREFFYIMSVPNINYDKMASNPICLNIPWAQGTVAKENLQRWKEGKTGYPFVDAGMRQLLVDGWAHHVIRNVVACFLTRSALWISWEEGLQHFLKYLLDADWSVCAGNWMWVSSSAFENVLDCSHCMCPTNYGRRLDPEMLFIKKYVPELKNYESQYIFEPWTAPFHLQREWGCIIGKDYPSPIVDFASASRSNRQEMLMLRNKLCGTPAHTCPSNATEARQFMWAPENCFH